MSRLFDKTGLPVFIIQSFSIRLYRNFRVVYLMKRQLLSRIGIWLRKETRMNKIYTLPEIQSLLTPVFTRHGVRRAILFGSYAKGDATERSDVDILVDSGLCGLAFYGLLESVVSALKMPVDLIDVTQVEKIRQWITRFEKAGCRSLDNRDISILRKLQQRAETIRRYCAACK